MPGDVGLACCKTFHHQKRKKTRKRRSLFSGEGMRPDCWQSENPSLLYLLLERGSAPAPTAIEAGEYDHPWARGTFWRSLHLEGGGGKSNLNSSAYNYLQRGNKKSQISTIHTKRIIRFGGKSGAIENVKGKFYEGNKRVNGAAL
ncbi:hypothetical protein CDAR_77031 [Caerostris darwini]|uniref:Uncharacterized protein n=1 Tax=Caerostris darwini TaxID=1538125 RepID=A0AAV4R429_9ARAC|nr:hypothetical protein CDAR_77031 [Caerostris darwini]